MSIRVDGSSDFKQPFSHGEHSIIPMQNFDPLEWEYVHVNFEKIDALANTLVTTHSLQKADWQEILPLGLDMDVLIEYVMGLICIDFCHWDLQEQSGKKCVRDFYVKDELGALLRGSTAMTFLAKKAYQNGVRIFDAAFMKHMTVDDFRSHFIGFDREGNAMEIPWLTERVKALNEIGDILLKKWRGSFCNILSAAKRRAFNNGNGFVELLAKDFPRFKDEYIYKNKIIGIYKLAQLSVMALQSALSSYPEFPYFEDCDALTLCADYQLPRSLRANGVLEYEPELSNYIDQEILLAPGSVMEIELRMSTIYAGQHLKQILNQILASQARPLITCQELDSLLWSHGRRLDRSIYKHHLSLTIMY